LHAFINGLFRPKEAVLARELYDQVKSEMQRRDLLNDAGRDQYIVSLALDVGERLSDFANVPDREQLFVLVTRLLDFEAMFELPKFNWSDRHTISNYWDLMDALRIQKALLDEFDKVSEQVVVTLCEAQTPILAALPELPSARSDPDTILIPTDKIRDVIGSGGKVIRQIVEETGAKIDISDDGTIKVSSSDGASIKAAIDWITGITAEPEAGVIYKGKVVKVVDFGAFVNFFGPKDGLVHISQLEPRKVAKVSDVVNEGDEVFVKLLGFDDRGKVRLSMKVVDQETGKEIAREEKSE